jgi:hypothetical protein
MMQLDQIYDEYVDFSQEVFRFGDSTTLEIRLTLNTQNNIAYCVAVWNDDMGNQTEAPERRIDWNTAMAMVRGEPC